MGRRRDGAGRTSPSETRAAQLALVREQAGRRRLVDVARQYDTDAFVAPAPIGLRLANTLDRLALDAASGFEPLLLSPLAPLGASSVMAPGSQDRVVSTTRTTEVVADPTNVLALECARRLGSGSELGSAGELRLATVQQTVRAQPLPVGGRSSLSRHFKMFALAEAGRGRPDDGFEVDAVARQLAVHDRLLDACAAELPVEAGRRRAIVRTAPGAEALGARVRDRITEAMPHVDVVSEAMDSPYYDGLRVGFGAFDASGGFVEIADLGRFDWVARLRSDHRLRFVASGFGLQLVPLLFAAP
ncbi:hypothetical protein [Agromyces lapidis]|uniref:Uncharacterized protein n=1 Tax=Agromyces lapidis TaxID=279574 RepID=A0ABV5SM71_9MICO|nr:hypothetical protein [Agromyces lapidis]